MNLKPDQLSVEEQADLGVFRDEWLPHELGLLIAYKTHPALYPDEKKRKGIQYRYCSEIEAAIEAGELPAHERDYPLLSWTNGSAGVSAKEHVVRWQDFVAWCPEAASWGKAQRRKSVDEQRAEAVKKAIDAGEIGPDLGLKEIHARLQKGSNLFVGFETFKTWWKKNKPFRLKPGKKPGP